MRKRWMMLALVVVIASLTNAWAFLDSSRAFSFSAQLLPSQTHTIEARFEAAPGYYLYHDAFAFSADNGVVLGSPTLPAGEIKFDENFQKNVETHRGTLLIQVPVQRGEGRFTLSAQLQGCADAGLCYPPEIRTVELTLPSTNVINAVNPQNVNELTQAQATLHSRSLPAIIGLFFVFGLLLSFTPCVLPMFPILSSVILGRTHLREGGESVHHAYGVGKIRGFMLALVYSSGMALVYTALGVAAGLAGEGLAATLQKPWVLGFFSALLVLFGLSMFGLYTFQLPPTWQAKLSHWSNSQRGGRYAGVFLMGAFSALILGPCMAAPLAGALVYLSQTRDALLGGVALFTMAVGMSIPLLLMGVSAGVLLPRVGAWMESIRYFFGVLLLAVALWMLNPLLPSWATMLAWGVFSIFCAVFLRVFDSLPENASLGRRFFKALGVVLLLLGVMQLVGVATGARNVLQPLEKIAHAGAAGGVSGSLPWRKVTRTEQLDAALLEPKTQPVMLYFTADWCVSCVEMEKLTFSEAQVAVRMRDLILLKVDITNNTLEDKALLKRFTLFGPPAMIFFDPQGREMTGARAVGFQDAGKFLAVLDQVLKP